jgi:hypothetical protein
MKNKFFALWPRATSNPLAAVAVFLDPDDQLRLAVDAEVDVRLLKRWLRGGPVPASARRRITLALVDRGVVDTPLLVHEITWETIIPDAA